MDPKTGEYKAIRNPFRNLDGAAGIRVAQLVAKEIDDGVITGDIGSNAYNVLTGSGLKVYSGYMGTSGKAVENYKNQKIAAAKNAQYQGSNIAGVMNYFHCRNCKTVVPCPYGHNGGGGNSPFCPSCGLKMGIVSNNPAGMSGPNMYSAGGFGQGPGTGGYLVCPNCGNTAPHQNGVPAYNVNCPKCGTVMCKQSPAFIPTAFNNNSTQNSFSQIRTQTNAPAITKNAIMPHEYRGVCSNCHQVTSFNNQSGSYQSGGYSYNNAARPYRIGPGGCIIR